MKITIREGMVPGATLGERLEWLQVVGIDGIELHAESLQMPREELVDAFDESRVQVSAIRSKPRPLDAHVACIDIPSECSLCPARQDIKSSWLLP